MKIKLECGLMVIQYPLQNMSCHQSSLKHLNQSHNATSSSSTLAFSPLKTLRRLPPCASPSRENEPRSTQPHC